MNIHTLTQRQLVRRPIEEVFAFFSRPENLERLTPKTLGFRILTPTPIAMKEGAVIDYSIRIAGMPVRWTTLITLYEPPHRFIDLQQKGPYAYWHHTHTFTETPDGTLITDEVRYAVPYGLLGQAARVLFVERQLDHIFRQRSYVIEEIFDHEKEQRT
jgi:ligand-binding SRPBCC domain-containing protein